VVSESTTVHLLTSEGNSSVGKAIGWFFQWDIWYVLAQLSYSAFLLHPPLIVICYTSQFVPISQATGALYSYALFFALITFIISTLFYLFIEAPFMNLRVGKLRRTTKPIEIDMDNIKPKHSVD
jgi:peptidoglycan/LPS O-acetylase OafA/YrhL